MMDTESSKNRTPLIVAPLSRFLAVADVGRSLAFYCDLVGFQMRKVDQQDGILEKAELAYGPALLHLIKGGSAVDSTGERRPRGSAILFFQIDDVAGMRDVLVSRGGKTSELEKVNWIKMRVFEIKDPDGHTLWFCQSFHQPDAPRTPDHQLWKVLPNIPLSDVAAGVAYYRDVLGFKINYAQHDLGVMDRGDVTVLLVAKTERYKGIGGCYVYVRDADALHAELRAKGAKVQEEPVSHPWGLRDFKVLDLEGNEITFGQPFE
jgi:uncharacterized glyoxalase superfamily protein PhnB